jgi:hypothetical protein
VDPGIPFVVTIGTSIYQFTLLGDGRILKEGDNSTNYAGLLGGLVHTCHSEAPVGGGWPLGDVNSILPDEIEGKPMTYPITVYEGTYNVFDPPRGPVVIPKEDGFQFSQMGSATCAVSWGTTTGTDPTGQPIRNLVFTPTLGPGQTMPQVGDWVSVSPNGVGIWAEVEASGATTFEFDGRKVVVECDGTDYHTTRGPDAGRRLGI